MIPSVWASPGHPPGVAVVQQVALVLQDRVGRGGEEVEIFTTIGSLAHARTEFSRWDVTEDFEDADEVIDTNSIVL